MKQIKPEETIATLLDGAPGEDFDFTRVLPSGERTNTRYRLQVLRVEENHHALRDSQKYAKEIGELEGYGDIYREQQAVEIILRSLRHPEKRERGDGTAYYPQVFTDARQVRMSFNETELAVLLNAYQITKAKHGALEGLDQHDAETWIARLSDPLRGPFFQSQLDSLHWPALIALLAAVSRDLYLEAGRTLPSLDDSSESAPASFAAATGPSGEPPSASSTASDVTVGPEKILTAEEARAIVEERKKPR